MMVSIPQASTASIPCFPAAVRPLNLEATPCGEPGGDLASVLEDVGRWRENRLRELVLGERASAGGDVGSTATSFSIGCKLYGTNVITIGMQTKPA